MINKVKQWGPFTWAPAEAGEHMIIAEYGQDSFFYTNSPDAAEHTAPKIPLWFFPRTVSFVELTWNEFVASKEIAETIKRKDDSGNEINKYSKAVDFYKTGLSIGTRTEFVILKLYESQPNYAVFISADGVSMIAIFTIVVKINNPIKAKTAGKNFLNTAHSVVTDTVCAEFSKEKWKDVLTSRSKGKKKIISDLQSNNISTDDDISEKLISDLKSNPFLIKTELEIIDVILETITVTNDSSDVLDEFENIEKQLNISAAEKYITDKKQQEKIQNILKNDVEIDKMTRELDAVGKFLENNTINLVNINKSKNEGLPTGLQTYVNNSSGNNEEGDDFISKVLPSFTALQMNNKVSKPKPKATNEQGGNNE